MNYNEILLNNLRLCNRFSFVIRDFNNISSMEKDILDMFSHFLILDRECSSWPGTRLYKKTAHVFLYKYTQTAYEILESLGGDLTYWIHPYRPEDLCFYHNEQPIFVSITHECDFYYVE